jgi:hypothetical protein
LFLASGFWAEGPFPHPQGFYIPAAELTQWAQVHPEYRPDQVLSLTACIAESSGLKRKEKQTLLAQVEADLRALSPGE